MGVELRILRQLELDGTTCSDMNDLLEVVSPGKPPVTQRDLLEIVKHTTVFVAYDPEKSHPHGAAKIVGMTLLSERRLMTGYKGYVDDVAVLDGYRGQHIGRRLMHMLIEHARQLGMKSLELTSNPNNPKRRRAIALYESLGFVVADTRVMRSRLAPPLAFKL